MIIYKNTKINDLRTPSQKTPFDFASIGYTGNEEPLKSGLEYAKQIYDNWDASQTNLNNKFDSDEKLVYMPVVDTSLATSMRGMFHSCSSLTTIPELDTHNVTNMDSMFGGCSKLTTIPVMDTQNVTSMNDMFNNCSSLTTIPELDTSKVTNMNYMFLDCSSLTTIPALDTQNVTYMNDMFNNCSSLTTIPELDTHNVTDMDSMFGGCSKLTTIPVMDIQNVTYMGVMFYNCSSLKKIMFTGDPSKITNLNNAFGDEYNNLAENGELIYDYRYDYTNIIDELHRYNSTWTAKPSYEAQECTSLSITADDVIGNTTTTTIHYTAMTNGVNIFTGERVENVEVKGNVKSEPFEQNPSYDTSRQVTVAFNYLGCSATTTIIQNPKQHPSASVDLMSNWELAPAETIPNPDPNVYEGVYQSVHKGQGNVKDKMTITIVDIPSFELYIRSYGESSYDYVFAGKLDQTEPTEGDNQASTSGNQQSGTALENYTKVEYPNDGGQHTITIIYRKDASGDQGDDRGYVFFKKPVE